MPCFAGFQCLSISAKSPSEPSLKANTGVHVCLGDCVLFSVRLCDDELAMCVDHNRNLSTHRIIYVTW